MNPRWCTPRSCRDRKQFAHHAVLLLVAGILRRGTGRGIRVLRTKATAAVRTSWLNRVADPEQSVQTVSRTMERKKAKEQR